MLSPVESLIHKLYHSYRHTTDIDKKGLFFSPTCMQICRPIPSYAATTREEIVKYLKDAQEGNVPVEDTEEVQPTRETTTKAEPDASNKEEKATTSTAVIRRRPVPQKEQPLSPPKSRGVYTIRPLHTAELEFSIPSITKPINLTPTQLLEQARQEWWIGMRVDLWDEGAASDDSLLVKVQYWWREEAIAPGDELEGDVEGFGWRQCLHDIMYLGPKDGTEGEEGLEVRE